MYLLRLCHSACVNRHSHRKKAESKEANSGETRSNCQCGLIVDRRINSLGKGSCIYGKIKEDEEKKNISIFRALITPLKIGDLKFDYFVESKRG